MANWKYRIDAKDLWQKATAREITAKTLAVELSKRLRALPCYESERRLNAIVYAFETMDDDADFDDFDEVYHELCNWGDTSLDRKWPPTRMCWVGTF